MVSMSVWTGRPTDEESRTDIANGFLRWKDLILNGLRAMRDRQELRADADLDEPAYSCSPPSRAAPSCHRRCATSSLWRRP